MSKLRSVDRIITAADYGGSARAYIRAQQEKIFRTRGVSVYIRDLDKPATGVPVQPRIWQGQWIADCECNGASFVDPNDPIFFCFSCLNRANDSKPRPVNFPVNYRDIEKTLLERPVDDRVGLTDLERVGMAKALIHFETATGELLPLTRSWNPSETLSDLNNQQKDALEKWRKDLNGI
jgi:hypothetical protein